MLHPKLELQIFKLQHQKHNNDVVKLIVDILATGEQKLKSGSLATFNKKVHTQISGHSEDEDNDTAAMDYREPVESEEEEEDN